MSAADLLGFGVRLTVGAAVLVLVFWLARRGVALVPLSRARRRALSRLFPPLGLGIVAAGLGWIALTAVDGRPLLAGALLATLVAALVGGGWFALQDAIAGVVLRAEAGYEPGEWIQAGGVEGRIQRVGLRSLELETEAGQHVRVPYSRIAGGLQARTGSDGVGGAHTFTLVVPRDRATLEAAAEIRLAALNCFFASATREPHIRLNDEGAAGDASGVAFEVTVYSPDRSFLPEIERVVRRRFERQG